MYDDMVLIRYNEDGSIKQCEKSLKEVVYRNDAVREIESQIDFVLNYSPCDFQRGIVLGMLDIAVVCNFITCEEKQQYELQIGVR